MGMEEVRDELTSTKLNTPSSSRRWIRRFLVDGEAESPPHPDPADPLLARRASPDRDSCRPRSVSFMEERSTE